MMMMIDDDDDDPSLLDYFDIRHDNGRLSHCLTLVKLKGTTLQKEKDGRILNDNNKIRTN